MELFGYEIDNEVIMYIFYFILLCLGAYFLYTYGNEQFANVANYGPAMTRDYLYYNNAPYLHNPSGYDSATRGYYNYRYAEQVAQNLEK
jgi:hypothetical protein